MIVIFHIGFGIIPHASNGNMMLAKLKNIPVDIMIRERYFNPCSSERYDINTAKGPHNLKTQRIK